MVPKGAEKLELVSGFIYWSLDNWETVHRLSPGCKQSRKVRDKFQADKVRHLVICQSSASA